MDKQLSFELKVSSSGKYGQPSLKKHLSSRKKDRLKQKQTFIIKSQKNINRKREIVKSKEYGQLSLITKKNQRKQAIRELLPKVEKDFKLGSDFLSLEGTQSETSSLKEAPPVVHSPEKDVFFENLVGVETVAEMLGLAPKTIHNWVYLRKIPYVKCGRKVMFRPKSFKAWLNRKEVKSWL